MDDPLFEPAVASEYIHTPPATMQWWRTMGRGPAYIKIGRRVFYKKSALDALIAAGERTPEAA
jgi:hypothetical protein